MQPCASNDAILITLFTHLRAPTIPHYNVSHKHGELPIVGKAEVAILHDEIAIAGEVRAEHGNSWNEDRKT
jgi:hypothetical protein